MLFLQLILYSSSFIGTRENENPGAAMKPCQLEIKQLSPDILKFSTEHKDNPFTLNCSMVTRTFLFIFHAGSRRMGSNNFWNSSYKENRPVRPVFLDYLSVSYDYVYTEVFLKVCSTIFQSQIIYVIVIIQQKLYSKRV